MLQIATFTTGLWQWYIIKVFEPEVRHCVESDRALQNLCRFSQVL